MGMTRRVLASRAGRIAVAAAIGATAAASTATSASASGIGPAHGSRGPVVLTHGGLLRGTVAEGMEQFRGIPYAAPPVGALRWRAPQPARSWAGIRDASRFAPHCAQPGGTFGIASTSEDCLFLNVFTPDRPPRALGHAPVMVWIHGGALVTGASDSYDPAPLVRQGVVVVTINYRLGELGFLAHPALAAENGGSSGDYGLMDQQAALRWVQSNIGRFGGDARNVTIFGESAGGLSVHSQLVSPGAHGLFDKAIVESGAYGLNQAGEAAAETTGTAFATRVGCASQTAACLRALPASTIVTAGRTNIQPNVDGKVLPRTVQQAFTSGRFNRVPVVEGSNHDEWALFVAANELATGAPLTAAGYVAAIQSTLGVPAAQAQALAAAYPLSSFASPSLALTALGTDAIFACNSRLSAKLLSGFVPTFQYEFNDPAAPNVFFPTASFPLRSYHAAEIQYLFGNFTRPSALNADSRRLSAAMVRSWTHFAFTGTPRSLGGGVWPRYNPASDRFQALTAPRTTVGTGFSADHKCALWGSA
jgi:para-nitrobenzyl esterase